MNFVASAIPPSHPQNIIWLLFKETSLLVSVKSAQIPFPVSTECEISQSELCFVNYLGTYGDFHCYAALTDSVSLPAQYQFVELRSLYDFFDSEIYTMANKAFEILHWDKTHQFCGQCGAVLIKSNSDFSKNCPSCGLQQYPRISPAIIVGVTKDDKILLSRHPNSELYSVTAGYVDSAETLEQAVIREVKEEVNIKVKNIKYFSSQPWVFSHALMVAFTAEYESEELRPDGIEIEEARWFGVKELPAKLPRPYSISRRLIDWFIHNNPQ